MALEPAKIIKGRVTYADTARPVPHARLSGKCSADVKVQAVGPSSAEFETDDQGCFRVNPCSGDELFCQGFTLPRASLISEPPGSSSGPRVRSNESLDLALDRGVVIRGKVTEEGSGKPVKDASVSASAVFARSQDDSDSSSENPVTSTGPDGSFQFAALARPGHLVVQGPSDDYLLQEVGRTNGLTTASRAADAFYSHAIIALRLEPSDTEKEVNVVFRRGVTVKGELVGPDGHPAPETWMFGRGILIVLGWVRRAGRGERDITALARNGHFELHGLDPDTTVPVYFLDPTGKLGTTYSFAGKSAVNKPSRRPSRALRCGQSSAGHPRRTAGCGTSTPHDDHDGRHGRALLHRDKETAGLILADEGALTQD